MNEAVAVLGGRRTVASMVATALTPVAENPRAADAHWVAETADRVLAAMVETRSTWQMWHVRAEAQRHVRTVDMAAEQANTLVDLLVDEVLEHRSVALAAPPDGIEEPGTLRRVDGSSVYTVAGADLYTSQRILDAEQRLVTVAGIRGGTVLDRTVVDLALLEMAANGTALDTGQASLVRQMCTSGARLQLAIAPAGAGKTTAMRALTLAWTEDGGQVLGLAPSAAAAAVLGEQTGIRTDTVAKLTWSLRNGDLPDWAAAVGPEAIKEAATRVLRGESLRSIAMDWNRRGIKTVGGNSTKPKGERADRDRGARLWHGSMIRRVLISPRIAGLREHNGEVVGKAVWPAIIDEATHDRLVGLLKDPSRRPLSYGRPRVHPLAGLVYCGSCGGRLVSYLQPRQARGYGCRKDENPDCEARVRIVAEPLEAYIEGHVIDQWRNPRARRIAQSDDDRLKRIAKITAEMAELQRQKKDAFRMKLRREVDLQTFREVTKEMDTALDQLAREHKSLTSEAAIPELPDPSLAWEDLSSEDRRALTEMLVDKIVISQHPHVMVETPDGKRKRSYTIRAIPHQDPQQEAERLKAVHEARVKIVPRV